MDASLAIDKAWSSISKNMFILIFDKLYVYQLKVLNFNNNNNNNNNNNKNNLLIYRGKPYQC